ncbi:MAG TPA: cytochrome c3 family protein [Bryobacteraceae bacterium]|nr:cytochrome c3 family protein [Bryobacteraceae bacterium]
MQWTKFTLAERLAPFVYLSSNWISRTGIFLVTAAGVSWLFTLPANLSGSEHPYLGLLTVMLLPLAFFLGLALIPLGIRLSGRRENAPETFPPLRWDNPQFRGLVLFLGITTAFNVMIGGHLTYTAVEYMDSVQFCGASCHIMTPEFTAYKVAAHSQVACVDCHIGEGAKSYAAAKLNGAKQLLEVLTNTYRVPVPTPVHNLAQGKLTCSKCHADRDFGSKRWEETKFASDSVNSATRTQLAVMIGGGNNPTGAHGAHMAKGARIEYWATPDRKRVERIRYVDSRGRETIFARAGSKPGGEARTMDCTDCHNRAAHSFEDPSRALDQSLAAGRIDHTLPSIKAVGLGELQKGSNDTAEALRAFYQSKHPEVAAARGAAIAKAAAELTAIRGRNVFPEWGVQWGTHPNFLSHDGCFRCHDPELVSQDAERRPVSKSCSTCHRIEKLDEPVADPVPVTSTGGDAGMPGRIPFATNAGEVAFDHAKHLTRANGDCKTCHDQYFPMERADLRYKANLHRTAEAARTSCAGCHAPGGTAFGSAGECARCHTGLSAPVRLAASTGGATSTGGTAAAGGLPEQVRYSTSLGVAMFDHGKHLTHAKGDCTSCHNKLFPMAKGDLKYAAGMHKAAEAARTSCAGCHAAGGSAFASADNCQKCHTGLGTPRPTPRTGLSGLPESRAVETKLGAARFDHGKHVTISKGDCRSCHMQVFPLAKGMLGYADNLHRTAEQNRTSCGSCHVAGGTAFASKDNCLRCHTDLQAKGAIAALAKPVTYANRLGPVSFDHNQHIAKSGGKCGDCHDRLFAMQKRGLTGYSEDYHRKAEGRGELCAACHAPGKSAFGSLNNCRKCHQGLELQSAN